ncbi:MAG: SBBP repeat-containing protein [Bacteroidales bacterium]|nr:SBBP repeat-containing protein [Bacteroidales bacterium]
MPIQILPQLNYRGENTVPCVFIENKGQWPKEVLFLYKQKNIFYWIVKDGIIIDIARSNEDPTNRIKNYSDNSTNNLFSSIEERHVARLYFKNGNVKNYEGILEENVTFNFILGNDPTKHITGVKCFKQVYLKNLYPGIDVKYELTEKGNLRFDFIVNPGSDPSQILLTFKGIDHLNITPKSLLLQTHLGDLQIKDIKLIQKNDSFPISFISQKDDIGFYIPSYNKNEILIIDPTIEFSSYMGGSNDDYLVAINKNIYSWWPFMWFGGYSRSTDFPNITGYDVSHNGAYDVVLIVSNFYNYHAVTYLGGSGDDYCTNIGLLGGFPPKLLISGYTNSTNFPTTTNAYQQTLMGASDGFVTCMTYTLNNLVFSTLLGGSNVDKIKALGTDQNENIYVGGITTSSNFPITQNAFQTTLSSNQACFVTKLTPTGDSLIFSTFLQGNNMQELVALEVYNSKPIVAGYTNSQNFPLTPGTFQTPSANYDIFVTRLNNNGSNIERSARFGGSQEEYTSDLEIDQFGQIYICGKTNSSGFPITSNAIQTTYRGANDGFFVKMDSAFSHILYSTYFGGHKLENVYKMNYDPYTKNVCIVGSTYSFDFPISPNAFQQNNKGSMDGFIMKINPNGEIVKYYSTYLGGSTYDEIKDIVMLFMYSNQNYTTKEYVIGYTSSFDFYTTPDAFQFTINPFDGFIMRLSLPTALAVDFEPDIICEGDTGTIIVRGTPYVKWSHDPFEDTLTTVIPQPGYIYEVKGILNGDTSSLLFSYPIDVVQVNVFPSQASICNGQEITLTASGANNYQWYPLPLQGPQITISPDSSLNLSVIGTSSLGCKDTASAFIQINYYPTYELISDPSTDHQSVCIGDSIQKIEYLLHHVNSIHYQPNSFPPGISASFNLSNHKLSIKGAPYLSGTYVYGVEGDGPCGSIFFNGLIQVDPCTSIEEMDEANNDVMIASNAVSFELREPTTLYILDAQGKIVSTYELNGKQSIDISYLAKGVYFFNFHTKNELILKKIVIKY